MNLISRFLLHKSVFNKLQLKPDGSTILECPHCKQFVNTRDIDKHSCEPPQLQLPFAYVDPLFEYGKPIELREHNLVLQKRVEMFSKFKTKSPTRESVRAPT